MVLAIDFDGVIHDINNPIEGKRMGAPIEGAKSYLELYKAQGHKIIIHSVKASHPKIIEDWMKYYKIPFDEITNIKPNADYFVDDRAIRFTSWKDIKL